MTVNKHVLLKYIKYYAKVIRFVLDTKHHLTFLGFGSHTGKESCKNWQKLNRHPWYLLHLVDNLISLFFQQTFIRRSMLLTTRCLSYAYIWILKRMPFVFGFCYQRNSVASCCFLSLTLSHFLWGLQLKCLNSFSVLNFDRSGLCLGSWWCS